MSYNPRTGHLIIDAGVQPVGSIDNPHPYPTEHQLDQVVIDAAIANLNAATNDGQRRKWQFAVDELMVKRRIREATTSAERLAARAQYVILLDSQIEDLETQIAYDQYDGRPSHKRRYKRDKLMEARSRQLSYFNNVTGHTTMSNSETTDDMVKRIRKEVAQEAADAGNADEITKAMGNAASVKVTNPDGGMKEDPFPGNGLPPNDKLSVKDQMRKNYDDRFYSRKPKP